METTGSGDEQYTGKRRFHGVYILYCLNPAQKGRTYIGYTVNPQRRIQQHNLGKKKGGAWKTSGRGPWEMVLIVHGFPNDVSGLRFEWAWQHPTSSRRLKHVLPKRRGEKEFDAKLRILAEMLNTGPWNRLPLTIQWLKQEYAQMFPPTMQPPFHMPIAYGPITAKKKKETKAVRDIDADDEKTVCEICSKTAGNDTEDFISKCCNEACSFRSHPSCLAKRFQDLQFLLPIFIRCPQCGIEILWADFIYGKRQADEEMGELTQKGEKYKDHFLSETDSEEDNDKGCRKTINL